MCPSSLRGTLPPHPLFPLPSLGTLLLSLSLSLSVSARELHLEHNLPLIPGRSLQAASLCPPPSSLEAVRENIDVGIPGTLVGSSVSQVQFRNIRGMKNCAGAATTFSCWTQSPKSFFLYVRDGVMVNKTAYNCIFGTSCGTLPPLPRAEGGKSGRFGYVANERCTPHPMRCPEVRKPGHYTLENVEASLADTLDSYTSKSASFTTTPSHHECQVIARQNRASFFFFSPSGYKRGGVVVGNCAYSTKCVGLYQGPDTLTLGVP